MKQNVSTGGESNAAALLKRCYMALSDGDWEKANEFFDRVLDGDAENAEAYMGEFLARKQKNSMEGWAETFAKQDVYKRQPLFCPKCKDACVIRFKDGKIEEIKMPDA